MVLLIVVLLVLFLAGGGYGYRAGMPTLGHSSIGIFGLLLFVVVVLMLLGRL